MTEIKDVSAEQILDSRGNPTLRVTVSTEYSRGSFLVPSGASTGKHEALELREEDNGVKKAMENVKSKIKDALLGRDVTKQKDIDEIIIKLDGTKNKSHLGANATIGVSVACAKTAASAEKKELFEYLKNLEDIKPSRSVPYLFINLINGGKHAHSQLDFQEYQIIPQTDDIKEAIEIATNVQKKLGDIIAVQFGQNRVSLGDEGGFAIDTDDIKKPLELLKKALKETGLETKVKLGLDVAASSFYQDGSYQLAGKSVSTEDLNNIYGEFINKFSLFSIEDPFFEDDFAFFAKLYASNPDLLVIGDDLTVTNKYRLQEAINKKSINAIIIKPNQIGTLTETLQTIKLARENNIECIISHRSGGTKDDFIADLSYAFGCFGLKAGAPQQEERLIKYNRLLQIIKNK